ncbi:beta-1,3-glucanase family protein [Dactylosporangium sp. CA-092794]|uniref:beta-1,3-glucanase family protein n=1 Tax=Dactylosporangium sp. CA-092794 TaxID=3239929 RepID=UPI003D8B8348
MLSRRTLLGLVGAGAAAIGVPLVASALRSRADAADGLPITVVNNTARYASSAITMYVVGIDPSGQMGYAKQPGVFTPVSGSGDLDIGVRLAADGDTTFTLPKMSGRIYFSIGGVLTFKAVSDGNGRAALQYPAGWVVNDQSYPILHDFVEFTYNDSGMFCNTTMVDMFSIPLALKLTGAAVSSAGQLADGGRDAIFAEMKAQPEFERLVVDGLRVIAPGHGIETGIFSNTYYDGYIQDVWKQYASTSMTLKAGDGKTYTGRIADNWLDFGGGIRFAVPSTLDVFYCAGMLAAPNNEGGAVAAVVGAGFNRSVLDQPNQPVTDQGSFYQNHTTNHYARILHKHMADGKVYAFPFDDVGPNASYIQDFQPSSLQITLTPFGNEHVPGNDAPGGDDRVLVAPAPQPDDTASTGGGGTGSGAYAQIAAGGFATQQGVQTMDSSEGGQNIGFISNGDWVCYKGLDFGSQAATQFVVRAASGAGYGISGLVEVRLDSVVNAPIGSIAVANTGGWQAWRTIPGNMNATTGVHDVYLTFTSARPDDYVNIRWLTFGH